MLFLQIVNQKENLSNNFASMKIVKKLVHWVKSRNTGFYSIEYSYREGGHSKQSNLILIFLLNAEYNNMFYYLIIEIKKIKTIL